MSNCPPNSSRSPTGESLPNKQRATRYERFWLIRWHQVEKGMYVDLVGLSQQFWLVREISHNETSGITRAVLFRPMDEAGELRAEQKAAYFASTDLVNIQHPTMSPY